jgi:hypothetical protein
VRDLGTSKLRRLRLIKGCNTRWKKKKSIIKNKTFCMTKILYNGVIFCMTKVLCNDIIFYSVSSV